MESSWRARAEARESAIQESARAMFPWIKTGIPFPCVDRAETAKSVNLAPHGREKSPRRSHEASVISPEWGLNCAWVLRRRTQLRRTL
jgi:hypothetical protein